MMLLWELFSARSPLFPILVVIAIVWAFKISRRLQDVERDLRAVRDQLGRQPRREATGAAAPPPARPTVPPAFAPPARPATAPPIVPEAPSPPSMPSSAAARAGGAGSRMPPRRSESEIEAAIGIRWYNIAGIVTLLFGVAFFLRYAYENQWIGPRGRVAIGVAAGIAAIMVAERARRRGHEIFSQGLTGGGIAALYLSFFFAFRLYHLVEIVPAFALMAVVTAAGATLALLQGSQAVALLSLAGGLLTPVLLSTGQDAAEFLFSYLSLLDVGTLGIAYRRKWRALEATAFVGTCVLYVGWYGQHYSRARTGVAVVGLLAFFAIFLAIPYAQALARRVATGPGDHLLAVANAAFTFGFLYRIINPISPKALGFIALALAAIYLMLGILARQRFVEDLNLAVVVHGLSLGLLTLAVPLELGLNGITMAWAVQGLVVLSIGLRYDQELARLGGLAVLSLAIVRLFVRHLPLHAQPFTLLWNGGFGIWAFVVAAAFAAAWLYRAGGDRPAGRDTTASSGILMAGMVLLLFALNCEVRLYCRLWSLPDDRLAGSMMLLWALFPLLVMTAGRWLDDHGVRSLSAVLAFLGLFPFLALLGRVTAEGDPLCGNYPFLIGLVAVAALAAGAAWQGRSGEFSLGELPLHRLMTATAAVLLLVLLTAEFYSHYRLLPGMPEELTYNRLKALLSVSLLWAVFAAALMVTGFRRHDRACRYAASGLFALTLCKVFLVDVRELREIYRIVSFIGLGLVLVAASWIYSRYRSRLGAAGVIAVLALWPAGEVRAAFNPAAWSRVRPVEVAGPGGTPGAGFGYAWVVLDREVFGAARSDLADLRLAGPEGEEVPYVIRARGGRVTSEPRSGRVLNRVDLPGGALRFEVDLGGRVVINALTVRMAGERFQRRVVVEGRDDGAGWVVLQKDGWVTGTVSAASKARDDVVVLPDTDYARLRVTVHPSQGETGPIRLLGVEATRDTRIEPETIPLPVASFSTIGDREKKTTIIDIDFGFRNARPHSVWLEFEEAAFWREHHLFGRNETRTVVQTGTTETGELVRREIEAPWRALGSGIFQAPPPAADRTGGAETVLAIDEPLRYLRAVIEDRDDRPLRLRSVRADQLVTRIVFPADAGGPYHLYYGNPEAAGPMYDLARVLGDLDSNPPAAATLGPTGLNPLHRATARSRPWSERYPWVLWIALLLAVGALLVTVLRNLAGAAGPGKAQGAP
jgi:uncharacterized membrane protein